MQNLTQRSTELGFFFQKSGNFFRFSKIAGEASYLPLVGHLWVWLNVHQYSWRCFNILEYTWINSSNYSRALNMHDILHFRQAFEDAWGSK